jgi:hypothetical protein
VPAGVVADAGGLAVGGLAEAARGADLAGFGRISPAGSLPPGLAMVISYQPREL